ncbi:MOSC domain-containing protein [Persicitalea sp.]|uniref:MOSC domain-containing protein n=1 Tax=Persicitalea sp. TaxID=3100273 RepID=UPI0035930802
MLKLSQLYVYPVKSLAGFSVDSSAVTDRGLAYDRRWMLVDAKNKFLTMREFPEMALLHTALTENSLVVKNSRDPSHQIEIPFEVPIESELEDVTIWNATVAAKNVGQEAADWFSAQLGRPCKLVFMPESSLRPVDTTSGYHPPGKFTSFSDAYPFLLLGEASMQDLESRFGQELSVLRFRPNLIFSGGTPYQEDEMEDFTINGISFTGMENCARCNVPNVDPKTGKMSADRQPLKTLAKYRTVERKIIFGRDLVHSGTGVVSVGDELIIK